MVVSIGIGCNDSLATSLLKYDHESQMNHRDVSEGLLLSFN